MHLKPRQAFAEDAINVEIERGARRSLDQFLQRALVACAAEPAPVTEQMHIGALAGEIGFLNRDHPAIRPLPQRVRRERLQQSSVMSFGRLGADTSACALLDLACEAWPGAALEAEQLQAQCRLGG